MLREFGVLCAKGGAKEHRVAATAFTFIFPVLTRIQASPKGEQEQLFSHRTCSALISCSRWQSVLPSRPAVGVYFCTKLFALFLGSSWETAWHSAPLGLHLGVWGGLPLQITHWFLVNLGGTECFIEKNITF